MTPMQGIRGGAAVPLLLWLAVACGHGSAGGNKGGSPVSNAGGAAPSTSASGAVTTNLVQGAGGLRFSPSKLSVRKGTKVLVSDESFFQHTFTIPGTPIDVVNDPGQFQTVTINLSPGTYPFVCTIHVSQGMRGTLIVTP